MLRILIADDHEIIRMGLRAMIEDQVGWEVCAEAGDGEAALDLALAAAPDVAVLDVSMPGLDGLEIARRLRRERPRIKSLIFTMHDDLKTMAAAMESGARGYILKTAAEAKLAAAISALAANRTYFPYAMATDHGDDEPQPITDRELEVLHLIASGRSNRNIAPELEITMKTVESHRAALLRKTGTHSSAALVRFAYRNGLLSD